MVFHVHYFDFLKSRLLIQNGRGCWRVNPGRQIPVAYFKSSTSESRFIRRCSRQHLKHCRQRKYCSIWAIFPLTTMFLAFEYTNTSLLKNWKIRGYSLIKFSRRWLTRENSENFILAKNTTYTVIHNSKFSMKIWTGNELIHYYTAKF